MKFGLILVLIIIQGCSATSPIIEANKSVSAFNYAFYHGNTETINPGNDLNTKYRIHHRAGSSILSLNLLRTSVEQRATKFCLNKGAQYHIIQETSSPRILLPGNLTKIEIIFECIKA